VQISEVQHIVEQCLRNDARAQETLYKTYYVDFMKICLRYTGDCDEAANVLQESFIQIFTKLSTYQGKGSFEGWMKRIVINHAIDYVRKNKTKYKTQQIKESDLPEEPDDNERFVMDEQQLLALIKSLPDMQRIVFNLYVMEENTHQDIADKLGISVASSKWHLFEARRILKEQISARTHG
jgi:RNA polymerase sigma factor (sigma-70 family)